MAKKTAKKKTAARSRKKTGARKKTVKSVYVKNFTGRISQNKDKTISVIGRGRRGR